MPRLLLLLFLACSIGSSRHLEAEETIGEPAAEARARRDLGVAAALAGSVADPGLRSLLEETLERHPGLRAGEAETRAAAWRAQRAGGLPDMTAMVTAFLETPETRVGPQQLMASVGQTLPWAGKRALAEQFEGHAVDAQAATVEARRLGLVTDVRRLYNELAFVGRFREITEAFRNHLLRHEEIARSRYTTGRGSGQGVLKMQAEITRVDRRLLELEDRRISLVARLNELRDSASGEDPGQARLGAVSRITVDVPVLLERALARRPEMRAADSRIARSETQADLAQRRFKPDFRVGITYTMVDDRSDRPGRLQPPPDNGQDIFGVQGGVSIPLWRKQRFAGLEEALELRNAAASRRGELIAQIRSRLGDLAEEIALTWKEIRLLEDLLLVQAEEALESAQAAYVAGTMNALELFDAEHVLFEAETAVARARTDYLIALAELEGVVGEPVVSAPEEEMS